MTISKSPVKTYDIVSTYQLNLKHQEIRQNGQSVFWVETNPLAIEIHNQSDDGPVIAACHTAPTSKNLPWTLGNPNYTSQAVDTWPVLQPEGHSTFGAPCTFDLNSRTYQWKRTHSKSLGGSLFASWNFKLVETSSVHGSAYKTHDGGEPLPLAVYITTPVVGSSISSSQHLARIDYYESVGEDLELASLVTVLGMVERLGNANAKGKRDMGNVGMGGSMGLGGLGGGVMGTAGGFGCGGPI
ncbi:hypothetical protein LTR85_005856 [Meristemomyces frigidus]|nr:hypothetical protein LTR85_005856 [Meristemomyces frigidus]